MKFLVVDDSSTVRKILDLALKGMEHDAIESDNGKAAIEILKTTNVDCIILDINMPVMGGIEFLGIRKADPRISRIPVIVLSTQEEADMKKQAMSLGANGFIAKPFAAESFKATIKAIVG